MHPRFNGKSRLLLVSALAVVAAGIAAAVWYFGRPDEGSLTPEERREIYRKVDLVIADLEGGDFTVGDSGLGGLTDAINRLEELREQLPDELLPVRNLAVAHTLIFSAGEEEKQNERFEVTLKAVEELLARPDDKPAAALLGALFLKEYKLADADKRAELTIELISKVPDAATYPKLQYAINLAAELAYDSKYDPIRVDAIRNAYTALPDNLRLLSIWLNAQVETKDPTIVDTLEHARELLTPLRRIIELGQNVDSQSGQDGTFEFLDQAIKHAEAENWEDAEFAVGRMINTYSSTEAHRRDAASLTPHPLDLVLFELSDEFREANPVEPEIAELQNTTVSRLDLAQAIQDLQTVRDASRIDFDLDQSDDWIVLTEDAISAYSDEGAVIGTVALNGDFQSVLAADLDYDEQTTLPEQYFRADPDLVVYGADGVSVFENQLDEDGARKLVAVPQSFGLDSVREVRTCTMADIDHDKDLDLVLVASSGFQVWLNRGNGDFLDATEWSTFPEGIEGQVALYPVDWDRDVDLDVVVATEDLGVGILVNMRHGLLVWERLEGPFPQEGTRSLAVIESDGNVSWDLATAGDGATLVRTASPGARAPLPIDDHEVASGEFDHVLAEDLNNDSAVDLVFVQGERISVAYGLGRGQFEAPVSLHAVSSPIENLLLRDIDIDGRIDLVAIHGGELSVFRNETESDSGWIVLQAVGQADNGGRAGNTGVGSLVEIMSGGRYQAKVAQGMSTHFGLGTDENADVVRIVWTNGVPQSVVQPQPNQVLVERMVLKGSCPYIYTYGPNGFAFYSDCLWAAPIGLQAADGVLTPSRSWEYLRIPGETMRVEDETYRLLLTEELWETAYFDMVRLIAVDHPADVEVYSNEKVGPPTIADYRIHTVREHRLPASARDKHGRDVSDLVFDEDERYYAGWDSRIRQGLTDEHYLELDLGDLDGAKTITLFLRGWIYPTDTSWNIALDQHPELQAPKMPSIWVVDENDEWVETVPYMGFPGGKTKTISVDVSDAFRKSGDYRLRIVTSGEISWDNVFFTVDEEPVELVETTCALSSATTRFHGFSARQAPRPHAPERYDYSQRDDDPRWPPLHGHFTRYGDVTDLLVEGDDRQVVLGSGDAVEVHFSAANLPDLREGWKRDFILHCVGWDKDADLNTIHGQSAEPLPYRHMPNYPYELSGAFPATDALQEYLRDDQVRPADRMWFWRHLPRKYGTK